MVHFLIWLALAVVVIFSGMDPGSATTFIIFAGVCAVVLYYIQGLITENKILRGDNHDA
jgi:hypothetical protein